MRRGERAARCSSPWHQGGTPPTLPPAPRYLRNPRVGERSGCPNTAAPLSALCHASVTPRSPPETRPRAVRPRPSSGAPRPAPMAPLLRPPAGRGVPAVPVGKPCPRWECGPRGTGKGGGSAAATVGTERHIPAARDAGRGEGRAAGGARRSRGEPSPNGAGWAWGADGAEGRPVPATEPSAPGHVGAASRSGRAQCSCSPPPAPGCGAISDPYRSAVLLLARAAPVSPPGCGTAVLPCAPGPLIPAALERCLEGRAEPREGDFCVVLCPMPSPCPEPGTIPLPDPPPCSSPVFPMSKAILSPGNALSSITASPGCPRATDAARGWVSQQSHHRWGGR